MALTEQEVTGSQVNSSVELKTIDHIEMYVGNARQAAHFYRTALGFRPSAYAGLETNTRDRTSHVVEQDGIKLVLTSSLGLDDPIAEHVRLHGDGVKDIAFTVDDATQAFEEAVRRGAQPIMEPTISEDESGQLTRATIATFGDTVHSFIERNQYNGDFLPGYQAIANPAKSESTGLSAIDHVAVSVPPGKLDEWIGFYKCVMNFHQLHQEDVSTEYSAMNSKVVRNSNGQVIFPMMEPAPGKRKSQIEEYLTFYRGPGAQHIALRCNDIVQTIQSLRANGIEFLKVPDTYYETLEDRIGPFDEDIAWLRELNILVDRDSDGYMLQAFTKPVQSRPTLFWEVIERRGSTGFGGGNIKALFEAVEREQAQRGTL